ESAGILALEAPMELLPVGSPASKGLTTPQAWRVCATILRLGHSPGVRELAREATASIGWTSMVLQQLRSRGILDAAGELAPNGTQLLLDQVATERPMKRLEQARIPTGMRAWADFELTMVTQWSQMMGGAVRPGLWVC